jgi:hypothetical protein
MTTKGSFWWTMLFILRYFFGFGHMVDFEFRADHKQCRYDKSCSAATLRVTRTFCFRTNQT